MSFNRNEVANLLVKCNRRCCVCHKFCGVKIEIHHIKPESEGGGDNIENAVSLCFECHAEVNHYNEAHPKGRKFTQEELQGHKERWLEICEDHPSVLISAPRDVDVGPLEGMLLELEHNYSVVNRVVEAESWRDKIGCVLENAQYKRSMSQGTLLLIPDDLREEVSEAYAEAGRINTFIELYTNTRPEGNAFAEATNRLLEAYRNSREVILGALTSLNEFLLEERGEDEV